jgi:hypothetical protein
VVLDAGSFSFCENVKNDGLIKKSQVIHFESENAEHIPKVLLKCHLSIAAPFGGFFFGYFVFEFLVFIAFF